MNKHLFAALLLVLVSGFVNAQLYSTLGGDISFFSATPVENIDAKSTKTLAVFNIKTREFAFSVVNTSFEFPNKLMQEHFNEKYIESEKYPNSTFKGKVNEEIDLTKDGEYKVTVTGKLNIHGVEQERTIEGLIIVKDGTLTIKSTFKVKVADHKIDIPTLVVSKVAEEIAVNVLTVLQPRK